MWPLSRSGLLLPGASPGKAMHRLGQLFSNFSGQSELQIPEPHPKFLILGWGLRICISNNVPWDAAASAGLETALGETPVWGTVCLQLPACSIPGSSLRRSSLQIPHFLNLFMLNCQSLSLWVSTPWNVEIHQGSHILRDTKL